MKVAATLLTSLRLRNPDIMTYVSFWGGFGWIDTIPPNWFLLVFSLLTAVGLVVLLLDIVVTRDARRLVWLLALGTGWIASAAAYAYVCYQVPVNVHGRYLIGWWLTFAAVAWSPISFGREDWQNHGVQDPAATPTSYGARIFLVLAFCGLVHAYCLCFILNRYF